MKCKHIKERRRKRKHRARRERKAYWKRAAEAMFRISGDAVESYMMVPQRWRNAVYKHLFMQREIRRLTQQVKAHLRDLSRSNR